MLLKQMQSTYIDHKMSIVNNGESLCSTGARKNAGLIVCVPAQEQPTNIWVCLRELLAWHVLEHDARRPPTIAAPAKRRCARKKCEYA